MLSAALRKKPSIIPGFNLAMGFTLLYLLLTKFHEKTGCPVAINTSFNVRGEPIVCTPEDAFRCFMGNELDVLVVGNCVLEKSEQDPALKQDYSQAFEAD